VGWGGLVDPRKKRMKPPKFMLLMRELLTPTVTVAVIFDFECGCNVDAFLTLY
jgi:hypothetical protein